MTTAATSARLAWQVRDILDAYVGQGVVGVSAALKRPGGGEVQVASGAADRGAGVPMQPEHLFRIASCTKLYVAAGVHRLVEQGRLGLDDPLGAWCPDLPRAGEITVGSLLSHRSGLPDFEAALPVISDRTWTDTALLDLAFDQGARTAPGGAMIYCNTGYVLLGMIIRRVTGLDYAAYLRREILQPLGLTETWFGSHEAAPWARQAHGYVHADAASSELAEAAGEAQDGFLDATAWFPISAANAAGDGVATARDAARFLHALFAGRVLGAPQLALMLDPVGPAEFPGSPVVANGHGALLARRGGTQATGHLGSIPGYVTFLGHDAATGSTLMLAQNSMALDPLSFHSAGLATPAFDIFDLLRGGG